MVRILAGSSSWAHSSLHSLSVLPVASQAKLPPCFWPILLQQRQSKITELLAFLLAPKVLRVSEERLLAHIDLFLIVVQALGYVSLELCPLLLIPLVALQAPLLPVQFSGVGVEVFGGSRLRLLALPIFDVLIYLFDLGVELRSHLAEFDLVLIELLLALDKVPCCVLFAPDGLHHELYFSLDVLGIQLFIGVSIIVAMRSGLFVELLGVGVRIPAV